mmetsp:Transcript_9907/g.13847  ORF Transcript_9907/g.13847 Transcript_9907/m.13847 type:complete len:317 (-) Transcript_9907:252-1202(-)
MVVQLSADDDRTNALKQGWTNVSMAVDCLHAMLYKEDTTYPSCANYLAKYDLDSKNISTTDTKVVAKRSMHISQTLRQKICEWSFDVVDHFGYQREAAVLSTCYFDRFASISQVKGDPLSPRRFQLAAVASLLIAVKVDGMREIQSGKITISMLVTLSRGRYSFQEIQQMEREILNVLQWKLNPPTTIRFISQLAQFFPAFGNSSSRTSHDIYLNILEMANYFAELSVCVPELAIEHKPSAIAFACLLSAINLTDTSSLPYGFCQSFKDSVEDALKDRVNPKKVNEIVAILELICPNKISEHDLNNNLQKDTMQPQ